MKCPQCGFKNEEGSKFCKNCCIPLSKQEYSKDNPYLKIVDKKEETVEEEWIPDKKEGREKDQLFELISDEEDEEDKIRNKIEKEERIRAEVKTKIEKEKNKSSLGAGCLGFLVLVAIVYFFMFNPFSSQKKESEIQPSIIHLNASVSFTGTQFIIKNNNKFAWVNVKMEVNGSILKGGFILKEDGLMPGETYTVGALEFAKGDGTRLNPFVIKPKDFDIYCYNSKGDLIGSWHGSFE